MIVLNLKLNYLNWYRLIPEVSEILFSGDLQYKTENKTVSTSKIYDLKSFILNIYKANNNSLVCV